MLGIASYFDIKTRMVPDVIWLIFGGLGTILYFFDWSNMTSYHILSMIFAGSIALLFYVYKITGVADIFAILNMAVILPVYYGFVMVPIAILIVSFMIAGTVILFCCMKQKGRHSKSIKQVKPQPFIAYMFGVAIFLLY
jgi:hypothetical protein